MISDKTSINSDELQIGMYVELPDPWFYHDFLFNKFKITSQSQLDKLRRLQYRNFVVDFSKSDVHPPGSKAGAQSSPPVAKQVKNTKFRSSPSSWVSPPPRWSSSELMTDELRNILEDQALPAEKKSIAVYRNSVSMMEQLLEFPTIENIHASKQAIYAISDMVLREDETALNMLQISSHDFYTYTHSVNVGLTSVMLCKELFKNSDAHNLHELAAGFFLHDLGKIKIDPEILNKPSRLSDEEYKRIKTHPYQGFKLLKHANALSHECSVIVMQHHEYVDGSGYPRRLAEDEIHLYAKICTIADVFDALTAQRSYKQAMTPFDALNLMKKELVQHYDKELFRNFVNLFY